MMLIYFESIINWKEWLICILDPMWFELSTLDLGVVFVILCAGIVEGIKGETLKLWDQGLCEENHHKPITFYFISSVIQFRYERGHDLVHL